MEIRPIGPLYTMLTSNQDLQKEINALDAQMQDLEPESPEYQYDQLYLALEKETQTIREENPNLDPLNPVDNAKLTQLINQNPTCQRIFQQLNEIEKAFPSEVSTWGIPWYPTTGCPIQ